MVKILDRILGKTPEPVAFNSYPLQYDVSHVSEPLTFDLSPVSEAVSNVIALDDLNAFAYAGQTTPAGYEHSFFDGEKFFGGFGTTQLFNVDYWTLRARSAQLFNENLYAAGLIRRLITNEINTGLTPEATPDEALLGISEDDINDWTETTENRFAIWAADPTLCDYKGKRTFAAIQRAARMEALISGDVLVVLRNSQRTRLPQVQLIRGDKIQTPYFAQQYETLAPGHEIVHGVEFDPRGREVAFHVMQKDGSFKRLPAYGARSGRRLAWLVYGTDRRLDEVRGQPLLSLVLQSLKEIDRYRDSVQRKAVINSLLAMFIKKTENKMSTLPLSSGAVRKNTATVTDGDGTARTFNIQKQMPGLVLEELQQGEEPVGFHSQGTDLNFQAFEEAIIAAIAWANEVPPEILRLAFSNNYSASQAAINEFKIYLNRVWAEFGETFCSPIYQDWLLSEALLQKISAPGLLDAWRDPRKYDIYGAWTLVDWYGSIKPSTDMLKQAKGSELLVENGWSSNARESRTLTGTKFSKNMKRIKRENELKAEAMRPLAEFRAEFGLPQDPEGTADPTASVDELELEARIEDLLDERGVNSAS